MRNIAKWPPNHNTYVACSDIHLKALFPYKQNAEQREALLNLWKYYQNETLMYILYNHNYVLWNLYD